MKTVLCLDIGSTSLKIAVLQNGKCIAQPQRAHSPAGSNTLAACAESYLSSCGLADVSRIAVTGVGASLAGETLLGLPVTHIDEFRSIAAGGLHLSGKDRALIISMGTGTAFLYADKETGEVRHLGGTGIGGGTLCGLCRHLIGTSDFHEIESLASQGRYSTVDLTIGDVSPTAIDTLSAELTAANFARLTSAPSPADLAAGAVNMVLQGIGSMAVFLAASCSTRDIVVTGSLAAIAQAKPAYDFFNRMYDISFTIADEPSFACALGAGLSLV
ncbi:MAG: pantothenate kinase [Oscillospiraceae bacterium]|nr:pantothenate kinase [Oscillospiraceae bacterium]